MAKPTRSFAVSVLEDDSYEVLVKTASRRVRAEFRVKLPKRGTRSPWLPGKPDYKHHLKSLETLHEEALSAVQRFCKGVAATPD